MQIVLFLLLHHSVLDLERNSHDFLDLPCSVATGWSTRRCNKYTLINQPLEWLLFSSLRVVLAFVHLYTLFMIVPIFDSMMRIDRALLRRPGYGASGWRRRSPT